MARAKGEARIGTLEREAIDRSSLGDVVGRALGQDGLELGAWECRPLVYDVRNVGALGVYRLDGTAHGDGTSYPWSVVLKIVRNPAGVEIGPGITVPSEELPPEHASYWMREVLAYRSGILADLPEGVSAPRCFAVSDAAPQVVWLWLEDLTAYGGPWTLARYEATARDLGRWNGAYLADRPLPAHPWLRYDWLASWVAQVNPRRPMMLAAVTAHPLLRVAFTPALLDRFNRLWDAASIFVGARARLPLTLCHRDAFPANLFSRTGSAGKRETLAIDWAFAGIGPVGEELGPLVTMRADPDPGLAPHALREAAFGGYLLGLREAGWDGDPRLVWLGYATTAPLRYSFATLGALARTLLADDGVGVLEQQRAQPIGQIIAHDAAFVADLLDLADEAEALLPLVPAL